MQTLNPPLNDWHGRSVWLVGASSGIGAATASALHVQGARVVVSARNAAALAGFVARHPGARAMTLDVTDAAQVKDCANAIQASQGLDCVVYCAGHYHDMHATRLDLDDMLRHNAINYLGALYVLDAVLPHLLAAAAPRRGHISLIGSVAGYRGLPRSLAYGPTKAALINLAETLYMDLHELGIGVSLISPGFVETPLTAGNLFRMPALLSPQQAAQAILAGWARGRFEIHFPRRFTLLMKLLRFLPDRAFFSVVHRIAQS